MGSSGGSQVATFSEYLSRGNVKIDGLILSKFDAVDDKIGTVLNMGYSSGVPVLFVGVGQTYTDLRALGVDEVVDTLLS